MTSDVILTVVFRRAEIDGGYVAECLEIPGCMSQGETEDEARRNLRDAVVECMSVMIEDTLVLNAAARSGEIVGAEKTETLQLDLSKIRVMVS